jgi:hypothetical protein
LLDDSPILFATDNYYDFDFVSDTDSENNFVDDDIKYPLPVPQPAKGTRESRLFTRHQSNSDPESEIIFAEIQPAIINPYRHSIPTHNGLTKKILLGITLILMSVSIFLMAMAGFTPSAPMTFSSSDSDISFNPTFMRYPNGSAPSWDIDTNLVVSDMSETEWNFVISDMSDDQIFAAYFPIPILKDLCLTLRVHDSYFQQQRKLLGYRGVHSRNQGGRWAHALIRRMWIHWMYTKGRIL